MEQGGLEQGGRFLVSSAFEQDGTSIYYNSSSDHEEGIIIKADGTHLVSFDFQEMTFSTCDAKETVSISITATLVGGGTVTHSVAGYAMIFGNTYDGSRRVVFAQQGSTGTPAIVNGNAFTGQSDFIAATDIGGGWRCVYNDTGRTVNITGLRSDTAYRFAVCEYNGTGGGEADLTTSGTNLLNAATEGATSALTYDFSNLGSATGGGFKPQGGRFLVSEGFEQDGTGIYFDSSAESESDIIIRSDGSNLVSFDLIDLVISPFQEDRTISLSITAQLAGGGNQSQSITQFAMLHGLQYALTFMGMDFSLFDDATELSIAVTIHESSVNNFSFETITLDDMKAPGTPPTVSTQAVTDISADAATANGTIETIGEPAAAAHGFVWNTGGVPTLADNFFDLGGVSQGSYNSTLAGLSAYTTYFVRSYATNVTGTVHGNQVTFTTSAVIPVVDTQAVSAIGATSATASGTLTELGAPSPTAHGFVWNSSGSPTLADNTADLGTASSTGVFNRVLSGLSAHTIYYARAYVTSAAQTRYGNEITFTTWAPPIAAAGGDRTTLSEEMVTLDGTGSTDPDGRIEGWQWIQIEGPTVALSNADTATPQFEAPQVDDGSEIIVTLRLTVTDNDGLTALDNCQVTVSANSSGGGGDDGGFCFIGTIMGN